MIQHESGTTADGEDRKPKFVVKGEPGSNNEYLVVEVINEEVEYDEGEYELDAEEMVEVDGTDAYKLSEDNELVSGFDFDEDESGMKN